MTDLWLGKFWPVMGQGAVELEISLTGAPEAVAALKDSRLICGLTTAAGRWRHIHERHFDTREGRLAAAGISLRLRGEGAAAIQSARRTLAPLSIPKPLERPVGVSGFPAPTGDPDMDAAIASTLFDLRVIAETRVDRWSAALRYGQSSFDLSIDLGRAAPPSGLKTDRGAEPIAEAEIAFVAGDKPDLFELARLIVDNSALRLGAPMKTVTAANASRNLDRFAVGKFKKPPINPEAPAADALQSMIAAAADRVIRCQDLILQLRSPTGPHQMRVALRRFRSVERVFRPALQTNKVYALTRRARSIAQALGPARDMDVFLFETMPDVFGRENEPHGAGALRAEAERMRAQAWADAHKAVAQQAFVHFTIDLAEAGVLAPWRAHLHPQARAPLWAFAPFALNRALKKAYKAERLMDRTQLAARHPLRIALKKHRYAAQLFGKLYDPERRRPYMTALSRLQDALGIVNDAVVAQEVADAAGAGAGPDAMRAAGFISGYKAAEAEAAADEIDRAWTEFLETPAFWRHDG
ncbi:MAG: CHAD domain-containing protein [Pseudomonadota bacterium]